MKTRLLDFFIAILATIRYTLPGIAIVIAIVITITAVLDYARNDIVIIPKNMLPGYILTVDNVTYQVRPIKCKYTVYWDNQADSVYRSMMEVESK